MRQFMAALAALLVALPAAAQVQVTPYNGTANTNVTGALTTSGDFVQTNTIGSQWATVQWSVIGTAGTATITTEISLDGGINWLPSAYSKRLDAVSANPSVSVWSNNGPVSGSSWETPLPGNATTFRVRCATTGTTSTIRLAGGTPYVPGIPVTAVLYDVIEASIGAGIAAYVQDTSGWNAISLFALSPTGVSASVRSVDDAGVALTNPGSLYTFTAASASTLYLSRGVAATANTVAAGIIQGGPLFARRLSWTIPAGGTVSTGRIRAEATR